MLVTLFMGFSSGLPLLATGGTLQAWMTSENVSLRTIGIFSLVGLPYTLKFLWAPVMDRFVPPFLGRRRGWILITQTAVLLSLCLLGLARPAVSPWLVALLALLVTFSSASQDIVIDAHRRDTLKDEELGLGSSLFINGYRIGMLMAGAVALWLADRIPWSHVYFILGGSMVIGILTTFVAPEPDTQAPPPRSFREAVFDPFIEYFRRDGALVILTFILFYKLGDIMASAMTTPFILNIGFSKTELAVIVKTFGLVASIIGGLAGGLLIFHIGINKALWVFGLLQALSVLSFSFQAAVGYSVPLLSFIIAFENLSFGMGTAAYSAFMASLCNKRFSATQYALLSSLMGIPRTIVAAPTGYLADVLGWPLFFTVCAAAALPGMFLLLLVAPWDRKSQ